MSIFDPFAFAFLEYKSIILRCDQPSNFLVLPLSTISIKAHVLNMLTETVVRMTLPQISKITATLQSNTTLTSPQQALDSFSTEAMS